MPKVHTQFLRARRVLLGVVLAVISGAAMAASEPFTEARFQALQKEGALILVDIHADWCPTCATQQKLVDAYQAAHPDTALHRLLVDFDKQKEWVKHFKAPRQSTLLLYRGTEQKWFSVAETRAEEIAKAIDSAAATP
jgi:thioredoxin 1